MSQVRLLLPFIENVSAARWSSNEYEENDGRHGTIIIAWKEYGANKMPFFSSWFLSSDGWFDQNYYLRLHYADSLMRQMEKCSALSHSRKTTAESF